jgi:geranylgeranyl diphosphate synthase type I
VRARSDPGARGILGDVEPGPRPIDLEDIRRRVDEVLRARLAGAREELSGLPPAASDLVDEILRLLDAGGKRLRPVLCVLGHVAAGGRPEDALGAGAALELFHTFALIHDDVMDDEEERRGVAATHRRFAKAEPGGEAFGRSAAILAGDLAFCMSVDLLLSSPVRAERVLAAAGRLWPMGLATAAGQYLDLLGGGAPEVVASLKTGVYTAEAPLAIGAELAGAGPEVLGALEAFARPVGLAFQLLDDVADGSAPADAREAASRLLDEAEAVLAGAPIEPAAAAGLRSVLRAIRSSA